MLSGTGISRGAASPYRRYNPLPALALIVILGTISAFVWIQALSSDTDVNEAVRCDPPASPPPGVTFTPVGHDALNGVTPLPPSKIRVQVLNAGGARGQARITTEALLQLGFENVKQPGNDEAYQNRTAECRGQLRYGVNGESAARTVSLLDPCVELIMDTRRDSSVDLAIGTEFSDVKPRPEAIRALDQLSAWAQAQQDSDSSELSAKDKTPQIDEGLLDAARPDDC